MHSRPIAAICAAVVLAPLLSATPSSAAALAERAEGVSEASTSITADTLSGAAASAPVFGVNVSKELTRSREWPGQYPDYEWSAARRAMTDELGIDTIRSGIYCGAPEVDAEHETFSPFNCSAGKIDDARLLDRIIEDDGLTATPLLQIEWRSTGEWENRPGQSEGGREDYYRAFGTDVGRALGAKVAAGKIPYFELGNEPDHSCIGPGNPWGTSIGHFDDVCVARAARSVTALRDGIIAGVSDVAPGALPKFAVGSSGIRWGMTDALKARGVTWDFTAAHWYYQSGYGASAGPATDQSLGFDNAPAFDGNTYNFLNVAKENQGRYGKPIVVTEFGVFPREGVPDGAGSPERRPESFERVLTGLAANAAEYGVVGVFAFTLQGPEGGGSEEGGEPGDFNLIEPTGGDYRLTGLGEAYRGLVADPQAMALTVRAPGTGTFRQSLDAFVGTAIPGAHIEVVDDADGTLCEADASTDGRWSCQPTTVLPAGGRVGEVVQTTSARRTAAPLEYSIAASMTTPPQDGIGQPGYTPFAGTGRPGQSISIEGYSGAHLCDTTVRADASWACASRISLAPGAYKVLLRHGTEPAVETRSRERPAGCSPRRR